MVAEILVWASTSHFKIDAFAVIDSTTSDKLDHRPTIIIYNM